jgi:hypothetical protein
MFSDAALRARSHVALLLLMLLVVLAPHFLTEASRAEQAQHAWFAPERIAPGADEIHHGAIHIFL